MVPLVSHLGGDHLVFQQSQKQFATKWAKAVREAQLPAQYAVHQLRHGGASKDAGDGVPLSKIRNVVNIVIPDLWKGMQRLGGTIVSWPSFLNASSERHGVWRSDWRRSCLAYFVPLLNGTEIIQVS